MELDLIKLIKHHSRTLPSQSLEGSLITAIGDDCAEFSPSADSNLLLTTDTMVEGVHFSLSYYTPFLLGRKLASVNLSDIAAMAGNPRAALLNLEVPPGLSDPSAAFWPPFIRGLVERLAEFGAVLAGGDTVKASNNKLSLTLTVIGEVSKGQAIYRKGARAGDMIYCSGFVGESALGLKILQERHVPLPLPVKRHLIARHLDPTPRLHLGEMLAHCSVTSMIDISDGIATDLAHICKESGVGADILANRLPISRAARSAASALGINAISSCLYGGEDYELLWTVPSSKSADMEKKIAAADGHGPFFIGTIKKGSGVWLKDSQGLHNITFKGYEH